MLAYSSELSLRFHGYCDASYADNPDGKSTGGYVLMAGVIHCLGAARSKQLLALLLLKLNILHLEVVPKKCCGYCMY